MHIRIYIEKVVLVVSVVSGRGDFCCEKEVWTVTGNKCDNSLLFIKLKNLTKGMRRHMRIYAYI